MIEILKVVVIDGEERIVTELVESEPVEFRVYYDSEGKVLFYTCDKPEGNYIVVDTNTYAAQRHDSRVIDGNLIQWVSGMMITKYHQSDEGILTAAEDISIIVDDTYEGTTKQWKMITYEL